MTKKVAIKRSNGRIHVIEREIYEKLPQLGILEELIGDVCDDVEYGDNCNTDCSHYRNGTCPSRLGRDVFGNLWHVLVRKP